MNSYGKKRDACEKEIVNRSGKACGRCGTWFAVKPSHMHLRAYCSRSCMAEAYRSRMRGAANPNSRNAGWKVCETCRSEFHNYNKARRYCSLRCRSRAPYNLAKLRLMSKMPRKSYNGRISRVDGNQKEIVDALRAAGADVIDLSGVGGGVPDLIVGYGGRNFLMEVKNPKTRYGRRGLNKNQKAWWADWKGEWPMIVTTPSEALAALAEPTGMPGDGVFGTLSADSERTIAGRPPR